MSNRRDIANRRFGAASRGKPGMLDIAALFQLVSEHGTKPPGSDVNWERQFYDLIRSAYNRASLSALVRDAESGPTWAERHSRLLEIRDKTERLHEALTGERDIFQRSGVSERLVLAFERTGTHPVAISAVEHLRALYIATNSAALEAEGLAQRENENQSAPAARNPSHRPAGSGDAFRNELLRQLMDVWKTATGLEPRLTMDAENFAKDPFCIFFESYFGHHEDYTAEKIARQCRMLRAETGRDLKAPPTA